jgi:hypothetical protein
MRRSSWHTFLHLVAYVLQGVGVLLLCFVVVLWLLRGLQAPIPEFIPDAALEPLSIILGAIVTFAGGRVAAWAAGHHHNTTSVQHPSPQTTSPPLPSPVSSQQLTTRTAPPLQQGGTMMTGNHHSCFISYSHKDEAFAQKLYDRLRRENLTVWFAPEDMEGGKKLIDQISHAIGERDKLLLVLSEHSMDSNWVVTEIRKALADEEATKQRKLFPIRLVGMAKLRQWICFDADRGKDLAVEVREYFVPDFSQWQDNAVFESAIDRLLRDLKAAP